MRMHIASSVLIAMAVLSAGQARAASLSVKILGPSNEPLPGASVLVTRPESWRGRASIYRTITGASGVATMEVEPYGVFDVTACLNGFVPTRLLHVPCGVQYLGLLNFDPTPPDQHMVSSPDAPFTPFNPCAAPPLPTPAK